MFASVVGLTLSCKLAFPSSYVPTFPFDRMADVTYNTASFPALLRTLASLLALSDHDYSAGRGVHESKALGLGPLVLLAYKERDPGERQLWDMMARETGIMLVCVWRQAGAGGFPVEIWVGKKGPTTCDIFTGHVKSQAEPGS
jgi:protein N-lysine methyltransferase METTL21D